MASPKQDRGEFNVAINRYGPISRLVFARPARQPSDQDYNPTLGTPVFLPPDPLKDPSNDANVADIWSELQNALESATHVLVLGHSLHDEPLVRTIKRVGPQAALAVATLDPDRHMIHAKLPGATIIDAEFGPPVRIGAPGFVGSGDRRTSIDG